MTELITEQVSYEQARSYRGYSAVVSQKEVRMIGTLYIDGKDVCLRLSHDHARRDLRINPDARIEIIGLH